MSFWMNTIFSLTIGTGALIGWFRFSKTDPAFLPFLLLLSLGFINEAISLILVLTHRSNILNFNFFSLIESFLMALQFLKWGLFEESKKLYYTVQILFVAGWTAENFIHSFYSFNSYFVIGHSFLLLMMSISMINVVVLKFSNPLFQQPIFLICIGLIIYFTYAILVEAFWIVGFNHQSAFRLKIYEIMSYINLFTNLLFGFAFLWIPMRPQYILRC